MRPLEETLALPPPLQVAIDRLRAAAPVERIILFGSRSRGDHDEDSDWDLCVLLDDDIPAGVYTPSRLWRVVSGLGAPMQIVPMRRGVFETKRTDINSLSHDIAQDGRILFDRRLSR